MLTNPWGPNWTQSLGGLWFTKGIIGQRRRGKGEGMLWVSSPESSPESRLREKDREMQRERQRNAERDRQKVRQREIDRQTTINKEKATPL